MINLLIPTPGKRPWQTLLYQAIDEHASLHNRASLYETVFQKLLADCVQPTDEGVDINDNDCIELFEDIYDGYQNSIINQFTNNQDKAFNQQCLEYGFALEEAMMQMMGFYQPYVKHILVPPNEFVQVEVRRLGQLSFILHCEDASLCPAGYLGMR